MGLRETFIGRCPIEDAAKDCLADELGRNRVNTVSLELVVVVIGSLWWWVDFCGGGEVVVWIIWWIL